MNINSITSDEMAKIGETINLLKNHSVSGRRLVDIPNDNYHDGKIIWKNIYTATGECNHIFGILRQTETGWVCIFTDNINSTHVICPEDIIMTV